MSRGPRLESQLAKNLSTKPLEPYFKDISRQLMKQNFADKTAGAVEVLKMVGAGAFVVASVLSPGLSRVLKPILRERQKEEREAWKRFNIPYLKRKLARLEREKLVRIQADGTVEITEMGKRRVLRLSLDNLNIKKPSSWDGYWRLVSYDVPQDHANLRMVFKDYLTAWGFYPFHQSVYLHAYPCEKQVEFLREYLGIGKYVRILKVAKIENDGPFRNFFGINS